MKTIYVALILFLITISSFSQKNYENGYFIDNENKRTECLIKNSDLRNNPHVLYFKSNTTDQPNKGDLESVKEFGVYGKFKFIREKVKIDRSGYRIGDLTTERESIWSEEILFLKVLAEGKASLYGYEDEDIEKYFYSISDSSVHQLIHKKYLIDKDNTESNDLIGYNNQFRQQLWMEVRCSFSSMSFMEKLNYDKNDLVYYFEMYNKSNGNQTIKYSDNSKKNIFNLKLTPGINISSLQIPNPITGINIINTENNVSFRLGIESEFIFPYYKNNWSVIFEPTFQSLQTKQEDNNHHTTINFNSIDFPIGLRRYFFINEHSKLFLNGIYISKLSKNFNSTMIYSSTYPLNEISTSGSFAIGGGLDFKKTSLEIRYYTKRDFLGSYAYWHSDYTRFSLIIGYRFFKAGHK